MTSQNATEATRMNSIFLFKVTSSRRLFAKVLSTIVYVGRTVCCCFTTALSLTSFSFQSLICLVKCSLTVATVSGNAFDCTVVLIPKLCNTDC